MFEAVITLCAALEGGPCREHLLPGYEARVRADCEAALAQRPPDLSVFAGLDAQSQANCAPMGDALEVSEVAPGVFVHVGHIAEPTPANRGDTSNFGFIIGDQSVAVIDAGAARWMGEALWRSIRLRTDKPVSHAVVTHMHPDHVFGIPVFAEAGAVVVGHGGLPRALADRRASYIDNFSLLIGKDIFLGSRTPVIEMTVTDVMQVDLGNRVLTLQAWPVAHTRNDVTVLDAATETLFAGDLIFYRHTPSLDGLLLGWRAVLSDLQALDLERVVPGHGPAALDWPVGAEPIAQYLSVLEADTRAAVEAGTRLGTAVEEIARSEHEDWELFETYNPRNATVAFTELEWE